MVRHSLLASVALIAALTAGTPLTCEAWGDIPTTGYYQPVQGAFSLGFGYTQPGFSIQFGSPYYPPPPVYYGPYGYPTYRPYFEVPSYYYPRGSYYRHHGYPYFYRHHYHDDDDDDD